MPIDVPTNLAFNHCTKYRGEISIMTPLMKKPSRLRKQTNFFHDSGALMGNATNSVPVTSVLIDRSIDKASINNDTINDMVTDVSRNE